MSKELEDRLLCTPEGFYTCEKGSFLRVLLRQVCHLAASAFYMSASMGCVF